MPAGYREAQPRPRASQNLDSIVETISAIICDAQGTLVASNAPLMASGLDSIAATGFASTLTDRFTTELPQTLLFDHPTIEAVASFISEIGLGESPQYDSSVYAAISDRVTTPSTSPSATISLSGSFYFVLPGPFWKHIAL